MSISLKESPRTGNLTFLQYDFIGVTEGPSTGQMIHVDIHLKRILTQHIINTYLPTICLIMIAELTLFIGVEHFEASIMVALTSMLVMYTLYQSISASLPQTAYMKMIDYWLLNGLFIPFFVFLILAINNILSLDVMVSPFNIKEDNGKMARKMIKTARWLVPMATCVSFILYWSTAIYIYSGN